MSPAAPQAGMGSHYPQIAGSHLNKVVIDVGKKKFSQASRLWPGLEFVSSETAHVQQRCVCACWFGCGWMHCITQL